MEARVSGAKRIDSRYCRRFLSRILIYVLSPGEFCSYKNTAVDSREIYYTFQCNLRPSIYLNKLENKLSCDKITRRMLQDDFLNVLLYLNVSFLSLLQLLLPTSLTHYDFFSYFFSFWIILTQPRERLRAWLRRESSSLASLQILPVTGCTLASRTDVDFGWDGYIPRYRRDVTYLREKNRRNEKNLPLVLADSSWETTREATFAKPICRNIRRRRCFSRRSLLTLCRNDPLFSTDMWNLHYILNVIFSLFFKEKKCNFFFTLLLKLQV